MAQSMHLRTEGLENTHDLAKRKNCKGLLTCKPEFCNDDTFTKIKNSSGLNKNRGGDCSQDF